MGGGSLPIYLQLCSCNIAQSVTSCTEMRTINYCSQRAEVLVGKVTKYSCSLDSEPNLSVLHGCSVLKGIWKGMCVLGKCSLCSQKLPYQGQKKEVRQTFGMPTEPYSVSFTGTYQGLLCSTVLSTSLFVTPAQEKWVKNCSAFTGNISVAMLSRSLSAGVICYVSVSHTNQA